MSLGAQSHCDEALIRRSYFLLSSIFTNDVDKLAHPDAGPHVALRLTVMGDTALGKFLQLAATPPPSSMTATLPARTVDLMAILKSTHGFLELQAAVLDLVLSLLHPPHRLPGPCRR